MPFADPSGALDATSAAAIRAAGARFDAEVLATTRALFETRWDMSAPSGGERFANLSYGSSPRQSFDLTTAGKPGAPILLYVPGGGFVGGEKSAYAHVGAAFARLGFAAAVMNYRLAPDHGWPAGASDVAAAIDWLCDHAGDFGADGSAVYVLAQSAGAAHASGALFDPRFRPRAYGAVRSCVLMSGFYQMEPSMAAANLRAYFGDDPSQYRDRSPLSMIEGASVPIGLTVSEFDPQFIALQTLALASALTARGGRCPPLVWNEGHNHVSPALSIGTTPADLSPRIVEWLMKLGGAAA